MGAWEHGSMGAWGRGSMGAWERGGVGAWERGSVGDRAIEIYKRLHSFSDAPVPPCPRAPVPPLSPIPRCQPSRMLIAIFGFLPLLETAVDATFIEPEFWMFGV